MLDATEAAAAWLARRRARRRWAALRSQGMSIGQDVDLPDSTWVDSAHCYLISIGDHCRFGPECLILSHDAQMDEFLDAGRLGRVVIHPWSQLGARVTVMAGVEIGPRTIVLPHAMVVRSLPADSVCGGNPARRLRGLEEFLAERREELARQPRFDRAQFDRMSTTAEGRVALASSLASVGGWVTEDPGPGA